MVMVPVITWILSQQGTDADLAVKVAIATSMATILFTSLSSVRAHARRGALRWDIVRRLAPGIVIGSLVSSLAVFSLLDGRVLAIVFALFVAFAATQMILNRLPSVGRDMPGAVGSTGVGGAIGFVSGLVGAGGGFVSVPVMTWCNVPIHTAIATSAALGFPIALANVLGYASSGLGSPGLPAGSVGYVWAPALAALAVSSLLTAPLGARTAHALPVGRLKQVFAAILYVLAVYMLLKGLAH